jgi:hypothetical protein
MVANCIMEKIKIMSQNVNKELHEKLWWPIASWEITILSQETKLDMNPCYLSGILGDNFQLCNNGIQNLRHIP